MARPLNWMGQGRAGDGERRAESRWSFPLAARPTPLADHRRSNMKRSLIALLTMLLTAAPLFAQTDDDHARTKKGAVIGGIAGAIAGAIIGNNRRHPSAT